MIKKLLITLFLLTVNLSSNANHVGLIGTYDSLTISRNEVKQLFLFKRKRFSDGSLSTLIQMQTNSSLHKLFVREILKMTVEEYNKVIDKANNSGFAGNIITVNTQNEMINKVSNINNSIGYIDANYVLINSSSNNFTIYKIVE